MNRVGRSKEEVSEWQGGAFTWSDHALLRWQQRFAGINKHLEFASATTVGKKRKKLIRRLTPVNSAIYLSGVYKGRYLLLSRSNIVFVVSSERDEIVTVFHLYGDEEAQYDR
ncbi:hypothetical protein [Marinobacterium litorale]|uniref:hypothetical protein n=1 Tax=Marinobacterium litorale TaxID=404770 RepID=UPI00047FEEB2|nr:hypothetical protein [Marinobacterium litorale]